jgi:rhodanese-related sulfurtransferase
VETLAGPVTGLVGEPYRRPMSSPEAGDPRRRVIIVCNEGSSSSLVAHTLQRLEMANATDLEGGFQALLRVRPGG